MHVLSGFLVQDIISFDEGLGTDGPVPLISPFGTVPLLMWPRSLTKCPSACLLLTITVLSAVLNALYLLGTAYRGTSLL